MLRRDVHQRLAARSQILTNLWRKVLVARAAYNATPSDETRWAWQCARWAWEVAS